MWVLRFIDVTFSNTTPKVTRILYNWDLMFFPLCLDLNIAVRLQINRRTKQRTCMAPSTYHIWLDTKAKTEEQNTRANLQERNILSSQPMPPGTSWCYPSTSIQKAGASKWKQKEERDTLFAADAFITQCSRQRTFVLWRPWCQEWITVLTALCHMI